MPLPPQAGAAVTVDNLIKQEKEIYIEAEVRLSHLSDLARFTAERVFSALSADMELSVLLSQERDSICERLFHSAVRLSDVPESSIPFLKLAERKIAAFDASAFTSFLCARLSPGVKSLWKTLLPKCAQGQRICYVSHRKAELAYSVIASIFSHTTVSYAQDLGEACSEVISGESAYCLLPYTDEEGVVLQSVRRMIRRTGLFLNAMIEIEADGMRYALLSAGYLPVTFDKNGIVLVLSVPEEASVSFLETMTFSRDCVILEAEVCKNPEQSVFSLHISVPDETVFYEILLFLRLFLPSVAINGCYSIYKQYL